MKKKTTYAVICTTLSMLLLCGCEKNDISHTDKNSISINDTITDISDNNILDDNVTVDDINGTNENNIDVTNVNNFNDTNVNDCDNTSENNVDDINGNDTDCNNAGIDEYTGSTDITAPNWAHDLTNYVMSKIAAHYQQELNPSGCFVVFEYDNIETDTLFTTSLRYQMSDKEADEIIANGGIPSANIWQFDVYIDKKSGEVTDDNGSSWYILE